jgi:hypothetical protein
MSASAVSAIYTAAAVFTVAAASIVATAVSSIAASNRCPHWVNLFGTWTYYLKVPRP